MNRSFYQRKMHIMIRITLLVSLLPSAISVSAAKGTTTVPLQQPSPSLDTCIKLLLKNGQKNQINATFTSVKVETKALKNIGNTTTSAHALTACTEKSHQIAFAWTRAVSAFDKAVDLFMLFSSYCMANKDCRDVTQTIYGKAERMMGKWSAVVSMEWSNAGKKTAQPLQYFKKLWAAFQKANFEKSKIDAIITTERKKANVSLLKTAMMSANAGTGQLPMTSFGIDDLKRYAISKTATAHISQRCLTELIINRHDKKYLKLFHVSTGKPVPNKDESDTLVVLQIVGELKCKILNYMGKKIEYKERKSDNQSGKLTENDMYSNLEYLTDIKIKKTEDLSMTVYLFLILGSNKKTPSIPVPGVLPFKGYIRHAHFRDGEQRALAEIEYMRQNGCFSLQIYPAYERNEKYEGCNKQAEHRTFEENHVQFTDNFVKKSLAPKKPFSLKPTLKKK